MSSDRPLILDANLAVLLIVGLTDSRLIASHRNLKAFDQNDLRLLEDVVSMSSELLWCPHLLAEVSSLVRQIGGPARRTLTEGLARAITSTTEKYVTSSDGTAHTAYATLGLTDSILLLLARSGATLLTADLDLHLAALSDGLRSVNFAEIRDTRSDFAV